MATDELSTEAKPPSNRNGWLPLLFGVAAFMLWQVFTQPPNLDPIVCDRERAGETVDVIMLSASWCRYCRGARSYFVKNNINYCEYDIERSARGGELYANSQVKVIPVIYIDDEVIVGFNRTELAQSLIAHGYLSLDDL